MILVAGEALVDLVIDPQGNVGAALGGAPFNTARTCGRLGMDVAFLGAVSRDRFGSLLAAQLDADGVRTDLLMRVDVPTTLAAAELNEHGAARYRFYIEGTSAPALDRVPAEVLPGVVFAGGLGLVLEPMASTIEALVAARRAAQPVGLVMVDVNCRPLVVTNRSTYVHRVERMVAMADIVKVSDEDLVYLLPELDTGSAARALLDRGPSAVLLTAGGEPVRVFTAGGEAAVPVGPVVIADTIGAGDAFGGGFISWWSLNGYLRAQLSSIDCLVTAVEAAIEVAAVVCGRRGADPPWRSELSSRWQTVRP